MAEPAVCAYCHGVKLSGSTSWIHATRFEPFATEGEQIRYDFCDDGCKKAWLDRADHGLIGRSVSALYETEQIER
jgi:hypothetical protein